MGGFLKRVETSSFCWRRFCRCVINRLSHALPRTWNVFTYDTLIHDLFILKLRGCNVLFRKLRKNFFCFVSFAHMQSTSKRKSTYFCLSSKRTASKSGFGKFRHKSFGYSLEKLDSPWMRESRTFERLSGFPEHPIDFDDFLEQIRYSRNGRNVC